MEKKKKWLLVFIGTLLIVIGTIWFLLNFAHSRKFGVIDQSVLVKVPLAELPEDTFYITPERAYYQRGGMTLIIPAINVFTPVGESTEPEGLEQMPGLYEFSQMPPDEKGNVSIAGHRDIYDMVFYSLDELQTGDYLYLLYKGDVYQYLYVDTKIVNPDEWSVIKPQGFECLTLTTCDPIGTDLNRLVVRSELHSTQEFDEYYRFLPNNSTLP